MPDLLLTTTIEAPPDVCFDLSLDVDLHTQSTGAREEIVGGIRTSVMEFGDDVTWRAWHFGVPFRMTSKLTEYERPVRFVDEPPQEPWPFVTSAGYVAERTGIRSASVALPAVGPDRLGVDGSAELALCLGGIGDVVTPTVGDLYNGPSEDLPSWDAVESRVHRTTELL